MKATRDVVFSVCSSGVISIIIYSNLHTLSIYEIRYFSSVLAYTLRQAMCLLAAMLAIALVMFNLLSVNNYVPGSAPHSRDRGVLPSSIVLMGAAPQNVTSQVPTDLQTTNDGLLTSNASILQPTTPAPVTPNPLEDLGTALSRTLWSLGFTLGYVFHGVAVVLLDEPIRVKNVSKSHMRV